MATADQIHEKFIKPLEAVLGEPKRAGADPEAIYAALIDDLAQFTPIALEEAMKELRRDRRSFPTISECVQACWKVRVVLEPGQQPKRVSSKETEIWNARLAAIRRVRSDAQMARAADDQGWLVGLVEFAEEHERLPKPGEVARLRDQARIADEKCYVEGAPGLTESLSTLRKAMKDRAHREVFARLSRGPGEAA